MVRSLQPFVHVAAAQTTYLTFVEVNQNETFGANGRPWKNSDICITHHVWYGLTFFHFTDRILLLLDWREQQHGFGLEDGSAA